jgi:hypothetical protein
MPVGGGELSASRAETTRGADALPQVPLLSHFHPSVALHAEQLLLSQRISTTADLSLNTLAHFLDRFVYRNPKTTHASKGSSIMQPAAAAAGPGGAGVETSVVRTKGQGIADDEYVNSEKFWRKKAGDVPVDQVRDDPSAHAPGPLLTLIVWPPALLPPVLQHALGAHGRRRQEEQQAQGCRLGRRRRCFWLGRRRGGLRRVWQRERLARD